MSMGMGRASVGAVDGRTVTVYGSPIMSERRAVDTSAARSTRIMLGVATLALAAAAVVFWLGDSPAGAGVTARSAAVLGAVWLAFPAFAELRWRTVLIAFGALAVILYRPRSGWLVAIAAAAALASMRRSKARGDDRP